MVCSEGDDCLCVVAMFAHRFTKVLVEELFAECLARDETKSSSDV